MTAEPNPLARKLAYSGVIPFVGGAVFIWLLAGRVDESVFVFLVRAVTSYAALVVSFLGGLPWGLAMLSSQYNVEPSAEHRKAFQWGVAYCLAAWMALMMPPHAGLVLLGFLLIGCYVSDRWRYHDLGAGGWLTLRFRSTVAASLSCFLAAAQL